MTAQIIDGKVIAQKVRDEVAAQVAKTDCGWKEPADPGHSAGGRPARFGRLCVFQRQSLPGTGDGLGQPSPAGGR